METLTLPITRPLVATSNGTSDFFHGIFAAARLTRENRTLREQANVIAQYSETVDRYVAEVDELRRFSGLPQLPGRERVAADVVGFFFNDNRITLDVGSSKGVAAGMPVQNAEGLVGIVQTVSNGSCQVLLLPSSSLTIGAIDTARNPPPAGLLRGENGSTLNLTFKDPQAPVQNGDQIVTTGFSDKIPRGIPIGQVIQVKDDADFGTRRAVVYPYVSLGTLREVWVVK